MNLLTTRRPWSSAVCLWSLLAGWNPVPAQEAPPPLVPRGSQWKYLDAGDAGPNWFQPAFNDGTWAAGNAQLGFGDGDESTVLARGHVTYYFRKSFSVESAEAGGSLILRTLFDDGVAVYLNGVEVFRSLLPPGPIGPETLASAVRGEENAFAEAVLPLNLLIDGVNVLAAEVHQANISSSDVGFDLELAADVGPPPPPVNQPPVASSANVVTNQGVAVPISLVASDADNDPLTFSIVTEPAHGTLAGTAPDLTYTPEAGFSGADSFTFTANDAQDDSEPATVGITVRAIGQPENLLVAMGVDWKWLYPEDAPPAAWNQHGFDDAAWAVGPAELGYGEDDETTRITDAPIGTPKPLTAYFRHYFQVEDPEVIGGLVLRALFDDGVVVHLNGIEVFRGNMPDGPISHNTTALLAMQEPVPFVQADVPSGVLLPGINLVAVELHNVNVMSSDMSFDLSLESVAGQPGNHAPMAQSQSVTTNERVNSTDPGAAATLSATDADGDGLAFEWLTLPAHGTLDGIGPQVTYTSEIGFSGDDTFTFRVNDGELVSAPATVTIAVVAVDHPPVVAVAAEPATILFPDEPPCFISKNNRTATISLDATASSDPDGDALTFAWLDDNDNVIATTPETSVSLPPGTHRFALEVTGTTPGGQTATSSQEFDLKVVTAGEAVRTVAAHVTASSLRRNTKRQLLNSLAGARQNFDRGRFPLGARHLRVFVNHVRAQVRPVNPALASELRHAAEEIIAAVSSAPMPAPRKRR